MQHHKNSGKTLAGLLGALSATALIGFPTVSQATDMLAQMQPMPTAPNTPASPSPIEPSMSAPLNRSSSAVDTQFMIKAAQSDQTEIQTSQLALQRSRNPEVRQYAERMITEHTASSKRLMPIAMQKKVTLPKDVGPANKPLLNQLARLSGTQFDKAYIAGQAQAHAKTQAEFQRYLREGRDPQLRAFATQVLPIVQGHLKTAQSLVAKR